VQLCNALILDLIIHTAKCSVRFKDIMSKLEAFACLATGVLYSKPEYVPSLTLAVQLARHGSDGLLCLMSNLLHMHCPHLFPQPLLQENSILIC
jgi:hypothetical protein